MDCKFSFQGNSWYPLTLLVRVRGYVSWSGTPFGNRIRTVSADVRACVSVCLSDIFLTLILALYQLKALCSPLPIGGCFAPIMQQTVKHFGLLAFVPLYRKLSDGFSSAFGKHTQTARVRLSPRLPRAGGLCSGRVPPLGVCPQPRHISSGACRTPPDEHDL